jgi:DNA-directed RNA polymerases I, II, and III subunit RPABC1
MTQEKADDSTNQLFVFFPEDEKLGVKPIKIYTDRMRAENVGNAIIGKRMSEVGILSWAF